MSLAGGIAWKAAAAYLLIGAVDLLWQRHRHEKQLKMSKEEVKREHKEGRSPPSCAAHAAQSARRCRTAG